MDEKHSATVAAPRETDEDRGSIMIMVLVFTVIASLIVVPILSYAVTVLRVNTVSVDKREDLEAVRAGARVALADPVGLFNSCSSQSFYVPVPTPGVESETSCRKVSQIGVVDELTIPHDAVATQVGEEISGQPFSGDSLVDPAGATNADWWTSTEHDAEPTENSMFMPHLPTRDHATQSSVGHVLPGAYNCRVFFPGTYDQPIVVAEPVYFASGSYYFEESVTILGGAEAVAGFGLEPGCASDLQAFTDIDEDDSPQRFNIDGLGATFVFGGDARLIVDDSKTLNASGDFKDNTSNLNASLHVNRRYVQGASSGGARVSIMTVNGVTVPVDSSDPTGPSTVQDLDAPGTIFMPESQVQVPAGDTFTTSAASDRAYVPSTHTAAPSAPNPPVITSATALGEPHKPHKNKDGAAFVEWAPVSDDDSGGSTVIEYELFDDEGKSVCVTAGEVSCVVMNLPKMNKKHTTGFTLVATNAIGSSLPSEEVSVKVTNKSPRLEPGQAPTNVTVDQAAADQQASVSWDAPVQWPNGVKGASNHQKWSPPPVQYDVQVYRVYYDQAGTAITEPGAQPQSCTSTGYREAPAPTTCLVDGLAPLDTTVGNGPELVPATGSDPAVHGTWVGYTFTVTSTVPVHSTDDPASPYYVSLPAAVATGPIAVFNGTGTATPAPPNTLPVAPPVVPDPVIDVSLTNGADSEVAIAGYVAVPQGRVRIVNPNSKSIGMTGGIIAASYDIDPTSFGTKTIVGFEDTVLQRTVELLTTLEGSIRTSTMIVQINASGAEVAVNSWVTQ